MSVRHQWKLLLGGLAGRRSGPGTPAGTPSPMAEFLERSPLVATLIFLFTVGAIVVISSVGISTVHAPLLPNQVATSRVTALASFDYVSTEKTNAAREQFRDRVPPVYRLDLEPSRRFETAARSLLAALETHERLHTPAPGAMPAPPNAQLSALSSQLLAPVADAFNASGTYAVTAEDLAAILAAGDAKTRAAIFENALATLRDLHTQGVADSAFAAAQPGSAIAFQVARADGSVSRRPVQSLEDALTILRVNLATDQVPRASTQALNKFFRLGLAPNLIYDRDATVARQTAAGLTVRPVTVKVARGQTIVEPGTPVTPEIHEMLSAHRAYLNDHDDVAMGENLTLFGRVLLVLAMVLASLLYIRIEDPETLRSNVRCALLAVVVIANLALVRANYSLGGAEFFLRDGDWASTLPYVAPTALAPLIIAILIDAGSGIFMALFISIFTGVIYGNRLDLLVLTFLSSLVAIFIGRDARRRGRLVRAAGAGGLTVAAFAALIGIADQTPVAILLRQMVAGLATGLITGIAVVGLLPILESLFKRTTDITLLELTDYNHPLLRRMQLEAPGTYHHSLVVAQLSENAANAIGANPLVARVSALFHDVGKVQNPQLFGENHRDSANPHDHLSPAESARLIKQHVPDGLDLARKHRLPRAVLDAIQQHHGTTLVRYFYDRACELSRAPFPHEAPRADASKSKIENPKSKIQALALAESVYRYDGPKPQLKETAIISLADGVEAATRSLRVVNTDELQATIARIVATRIADGQLDHAPLTLDEINRIKASFQFTLLNMLHGRVAYQAPATAPAQQAGA